MVEAIVESAFQHLRQVAPALSEDAWSIATPYIEQASADFQRYILEGPAPNGRIIQVRDRSLGGKALFRLDYHPLPGTQGRPVLHYHLYPDEHIHHEIK
jgi:hypothetical protein